MGQVTIEVANLEQQITQRLPLECNGISTTLKYSNLRSGTDYSISAVWTTEDNSVCNLGVTSTCELTILCYCELDISNHNFFITVATPINLGLIIGLSVGLPLFLLTCCIIITIVICIIATSS